MGYVLAVPEQAIVVCNDYMIHIMKPLDVTSMLKPKKIKSPKSNLAHFGTFWTQIEQTSHCDLTGNNIEQTHHSALCPTAVVS